MLSDVAPAAVVTVTDATFAATVLAAARPVVVDFWAEWCIHCKALSRSLTELAEEFGDRMSVVAVDVDANPGTARTYRVLALPTLLVFRDGEVTASLTGYRPKTQLRRALADASSHR
jgi:thioredoxin 1